MTFREAEVHEILPMGTDTIRHFGTGGSDGASRLLSEFKRRYSPESIVSYADRRFSLPGRNVLQAPGSNSLGVSAPNYKWVKRPRPL